MWLLGATKPKRLPLLGRPLLSDTITTTIADQLLESYRDTDYRVHGREPFSFTIGQPSEPLLRLFKRYRCDCAGFITACNPYSQKLDPGANTQFDRDLMTELISRNLMFFEGVGLGKNPDWPGEASYLVIGLSLQDSRALGHQFKQNAIVWCDAEATPCLVLLR